jgi:hypothetical protein
MRRFVKTALFAVFKEFSDEQDVLVDGFLDGISREVCASKSRKMAVKTRQSTGGASSERKKTATKTRAAKPKRVAKTTSAAAKKTPVKPSKTTSVKPKKVNALLVAAPKRGANAFMLFVKKQTMNHSISLDEMKVRTTNLANQWKNFTPAERAPYEKEADKDSKRYQREKTEWQKNVIKRPSNGYMLFMSKFLKKDAKKYGDAKAAIKAGAEEWNALLQKEKDEWKEKGKNASDKYSKEKDKYSKLSAAAADKSQVAKKKRKAEDPKSGPSKKARQDAASPAKKTATKAKYPARPRPRRVLATSLRPSRLQVAARRPLVAAGRDNNSST